MTARRITVLAYGVGVYVFALITFLFTIGFLADAVVPKGVNDGVAGPVSEVPGFVPRQQRSA
jgi:hypothetical protein